MSPPAFAAATFIASLMSLARIERAAEDAGEREHVVDLVGIVAAAGEITFAPPAFASSGKISGVGFAQAKIIASLFIVLTISVVTVPAQKRR